MDPQRIDVAGTDGLGLIAYQWRDHGTPVVFLHGYAHHGRVWDAVIPHLAETCRPIALDLRGHGDSDRAPAASGYTIQSYADDLAAMLSALDIPQAALVGHSMGGSIALRYAADPRAQTSSLTLVDCGPPESSEGTRKAIRDTERSPQRVGSPAEYLRAIGANYPLTEPELLRRFAEHSLRAGEDGWFEEKFDPALKQSRPTQPSGPHRERFYRDLARVRAHTLVVRGIGSAILSRDAAQAMTDRHLILGRMVEIRGAGHTIPLDNPSGLGREIDIFLSKHSRTPEPRR